MEIKNQAEAQVRLYKDMMDLQKQLVNDILQMLPAQNVQTDSSKAVQSSPEIKPPENPNGTISKYA
ncbi:hypothetical protein [Hydrogenothermus marinus]|uniref:Uncharacterized protein n=1 Tax=Hydrogenothermus marinus TaxID=133270 RepID=A0A3M0BEP1_9AQUI|nr:hypothetical protein [Hydrogenothermus marinus]RMA93055.1 hypothetical protein CLV39_1535 [Hydrogenothermus marinus]